MFGRRPPLLRGRATPPPVAPRENGKKSREQQIYEAYQNSFDEAAENALKCPIWKGSARDTIHNIKGNTIVFPLSNNFSLMVTIGVEERETKWFWRCITCKIFNATTKLHKEAFWTRKDKLQMMNVSRAMIWPLGEGQPSYDIRESLVVFSKRVSAEDLAVIEAVKAETLKGQNEPSNQEESESESD